MWSFFFNKQAEPKPSECWAAPRNQHIEREPASDPEHLIEPLTQAEPLVEKQPVPSVTPSAQSTEEELQEDLQSLLLATEQRLLAQIQPLPSAQQEPKATEHQSVKPDHSLSAKPSEACCDLQPDKDPPPSTDNSFTKHDLVAKTEDPVSALGLSTEEELLVELESLTSIEPEPIAKPQSEQELLDELELLLSPTEEKTSPTTDLSQSTGARTRAEPKTEREENCPLEISQKPTEHSNKELLVMLQAMNSVESQRLAEVHKTSEEKPEANLQSSSFHEEHFVTEKKLRATEESLPSLKPHPLVNSTSKDKDLAEKVLSVKTGAAPSTAIIKMPPKDARVAASVESGCYHI